MSLPPIDAVTILDNIRGISAQFAQERRERQRRRELVQADFDVLRDAGFLLTGVPVECGGIWEDVGRSIRPVADMLRILAHGDPSVALVSSMHPTVLAGWLACTQVSAPFQQAWDIQRRSVFQSACDGAYWGTITSEPGSGGDIMRTKAIAARDGADAGTYLITGQKHFGSGSGIASFMVTTAVPEGESEPDWFFFDMRGVPWDGSTGATLLAPWDGHGMTATQSHSFAFERFPATRIAWRAHARQIVAPTRGSIVCMFTAVIVGIVENAVETARSALLPRRNELRAYERVEWTRVELDYWLIQQAYEGILRAIELDNASDLQARKGKTAIAELAETLLQRVCKVIGGGAFSRHSPFGYWYEDVRALGFLRPPWGLAYDGLFDGGWEVPA
jgi:alkylation response protein AidB-like acyl-CoA dehydrogenase